MRRRTSADERVGGVLVIGGAGFVGSHLVERLIAEGGTVDVVDDLSTGSLANLAVARTEAARLDASELHIHTLDACSADLATMIAMRRPREIFHLALLPRHDASPVALGRSFTSMLGVLDAARRSGVTKVVVALPATAMYGHPSARELPVKEGPHGGAWRARRGGQGDRRAAERVPRSVGHRVHGARPGVGVRPAAATGRRVSSPSMVAAAAQGRPPQLTGDGRQTRDLVYVDDVVDALVRGGQRGSGLVVNIGTGVQTSLRDLWKLVSPDGPPPTFAAARPDELDRFAVSPVRARIHLGWSPWTTLAEGLDALR